MMPKAIVASLYEFDVVSSTDEPLISLKVVGNNVDVLVAVEFADLESYMQNPLSRSQM